MRKRSGPRTEPWGTPEKMGTGWEVIPWTATNCDRSDRYDLNQECKGPDNPTAPSLSRRGLWGTLSKAFDRSNSALATLLRSSKYPYQSWRAVVRASEVDDLGKNPNCLFVRIPLVFRWQRYFCGWSFPTVYHKVVAALLAGSWKPHGDHQP